MSAAGMIRVYEDRGFAPRNWGSSAVLVLAVAWGGIEFARSWLGSGDSTGYLFGAGFIAASVYGAYYLLRESRDTIGRLEVDFASGQSVVTLWRPWGLERLAAPIAQLTNWRMYIAVKKRNQRSYLLRVNHPANPRPLQIELIPGKTDIEALRRLAPEAIADFEASAGGPRPA